MILSESDLAQLRAALAAELAVSQRPITFTVRKVRQDSGWLVVSVSPLLTARNRTLDEGLEGSAVWWPEPKGGGEVFLVRNEEEDELWLSDTYGRPPNVGTILQIYPPRFLDPLLRVWLDPLWVKRIQARLAACPDSTLPYPQVRHDRFPYLRARQQAAFALAQHTLGFLWGPPGTGKTTTLGALVASLLQQQPQARILMISSTNSAVDQALVAVDDKLAELGYDTRSAGSLRMSCKRIGQNFEAGLYADRRHLLPQRDKTIIQALIDHLVNRPSEQDTALFAQWRATEDLLRSKLREQNAELYSMPGLVAMTSTRAAFDFQFLTARAPFDYLLVDEASQVSLAYAFALLPLGRVALFAGDPAQLAPIVQDTSAGCLRWLGESIFALQEKLAPSSARIRLNEQSRMTAKICEVVGGEFYEGDLVVCPRVTADARWLAERKPAGVLQPFTIVPVACEGSFNAQWGGPIRPESAELILQVCKKLLHDVPPKEIAILTPFRSQRALLKKMLRADDIRDVKVSTVHRAQGSERLIVLFDPVQAASTFLDSKLGRRLTNVALSRAKGAAYVFMSSGDLNNTIYAGMARRMGFVLNTPLICELATNPNFPWVLQGKTFGYLGRTLRFKKFNDDRTSVFVEHVAGRELGDRFNLDGMRKKCSNSSACPLTNGSPFKRCVN